ncbi:MAG TPA: c-type cytochrome [Alphaproteobacteria bacterium]|nr:c-type cytochrome [Alphaproteobacteria bacterium]
MVVLLFWCMFLAQAAPAQSAPASKPSPAPEKTAGEAMKNVQVLKDVPASEWNNVMFFIDGALGVGCEHCHAPQFDADTKKAKLTARSMMKMVHDINAANFDGRPVVTCNTCHQGNLQPKSIPSLWNKTPNEIEAFKKQRAADHTGAAQPTTVTAAPAEPSPSAGEVFANYRKAVGGDKVKSLHLVATVAGDIQPTSPVELDTAYPDKMLLRIALPNGDARTIINAGRGWAITPQGNRELPPAAVALTKKTFFALFQSIKYADAEASAKVTGTEKIGDRAYTVIESHAPQDTKWLYFDAQSGLLYKVRIETRVASFGVMPTEFVFEDYRDVNGSKMPFSFTNSSPSDRVRIKVSEMQANVPMDPAKFEPPPPSVK